MIKNKFSIEVEPKENGEYRIHLLAKHLNGTSEAHLCVNEYPIGRELEEIVHRIAESLEDWQKDGTI